MDPRQRWSDPRRRLQRHLGGDDALSAWGAAPIWDSKPVSTPGVSIAHPPRTGAEGVARANTIVALDMDGNPSPDGAIGLSSIGMSNTQLEFCWREAGSCQPWSFMGQAGSTRAMRPQTRIPNRMRTSTDSPSSG